MQDTFFDMLEFFMKVTWFDKDHDWPWVTYMPRGQTWRNSRLGGLSQLDNPKPLRGKRRCLWVKIRCKRPNRRSEPESIPSRIPSARALCRDSNGATKCVVKSVVQHHSKCGELQIFWEGAWCEVMQIAQIEWSGKWCWSWVFVFPTWGDAIGWWLLEDVWCDFGDDFELPGDHWNALPLNLDEKFGYHFVAHASRREWGRIFHQLSHVGAFISKDLLLIYSKNMCSSGVMIHQAPAEPIRSEKVSPWSTLLEGTLDLVHSRLDWISSMWFRPLPTHTRKSLAKSSHFQLLGTNWLLHWHSPFPNPYPLISYLLDLFCYDQV